MVRKFLRWTLRTIAVVIVLLVIALLSDFLSHRVQRGTVLVVTLKGPVVERGTPSLLGVIGPRETPLDAMRVAIKRAATDPRISGLAVKVIDTDLELAQAEEIADLIRKFRESGKWAAAYVETAGEMSPGNLPYIVAAATGDVSLMPQGEIDLVGVGLREIFGRGTLDWVGVRPNFAAIGKYKTFANMFTEKDFTPAQREEDDALIQGMYDQIVGAVAKERGISADQVRKLIDQAPWNADAAVKAKLVERLEYEDQFDERIKHRGGGVHPLLEFTDYARPSLLAGLGGADEIAVIYCDGEIVRGESTGIGITGGGVIGSDDLVGAFKKARDDSSIRAVIFRVDSPGGSVLGSELIRHAAEQTAAKKPVVVSMSGYAASGGYWVSTPAARIVAEPGTITGSIGVVGGKFNIGPAAQKIYLNSGPISRGANFEMFDEFTDFTPAQAKFFQEDILGDSYQKFLKVVAKSRHMTVEDVDRIAQGRVWTGQQAHENKLVDELGGFAEALADAKKMAKIPASSQVGLVELPVQPGLIERLLGAQAMAAAPPMPSAIRTMSPLLMLVRAAIAHGGSFAAAYCPVAPVL